MNDKPTVEEMIISYNIVKQLVELGYPYSFQHENEWVVDYCYKISEIVKQAMEIKKHQEFNAKGDEMLQDSAVNFLSVIKQDSSNSSLKLEELNEKTIPKKVIKRRYNCEDSLGRRLFGLDIRCPNCWSAFTNGRGRSVGIPAPKEHEFIESISNQNYCMFCGQKIDWSYGDE